MINKRQAISLLLLFFHSGVGGGGVGGHDKSQIWLLCRRKALSCKEIEEDRRRGGKKYIRPDRLHPVPSQEYPLQYATQVTGVSVDSIKPGLLGGI